MIIKTSSQIQFEDIPVGGPSDDFWRSILYVPDNTDSPAGTIFKITAEQQLANDLGYSVEFASCITVDNNVEGGAEPLHALPTNGVFYNGGYSPIMGMDIQAGTNHYYVARNSFVFQCTEDCNPLYFSFRVRCRAENPASGDYCTSKANQGIILVEKCLPQLSS